MPSIIEELDDAMTSIRPSRLRYEVLRRLEVFFALDLDTLFARTLRRQIEAVSDQLVDDWSHSYDSNI